MTAFTVWLTGIPGSGKTTLSAMLAVELWSRGLRCELVDGEELRKETPGLGFSLRERTLHIQRAVARAQPFLASGRVCVMAFVSPHRSLRALARRKLEVLGPFCEVWLKCPPGAARARKPGLYARAPAAGFYEPGEPDLFLDTRAEEPEVSVTRLVAALESRGLIPFSRPPAWESAAVARGASVK